MSSLYDEAHRAFQDSFGTRKLADLLDQAIVHEALTPEDTAFITGRDMLFLSTVDEAGRPTVSYKGGAPGFVHVEDGDIVFPIYDGNGMFLSAGNIAQRAEVGLLFIDFARPNRLRVQGTARIDHGAKAAWPGAWGTVRVTPTHVFVNCGRYIHQQTPAALSPHVPDAAGAQPVAAWKRIDIVVESLPAHDRAAAEEAGLITMEDYGTKVAQGEA